ncbi:MAG: site-specific DNA-methyltransferase [Synechococcus sp. SB0668_bin_15]|nr:site-specific DNA-methyltransferase [Synechococcus sp. SB0668_bin_15]MYC50629.1 site-specific DNA-methyltransferase [Synechococcus sp. SB0662_bin_14]
MQNGLRGQLPDRQHIRHNHSSAPRNRTLTCTPEELLELSKSILQVKTAVDRQDIDCQLIRGDFFEIATRFPTQFIDLLILDPPYNLTKNYNGNHFRELNKECYISWFERVIELLAPMMKPTATLYVCSDWKTSTLVLPVLEKRFLVQNRITWEREKGRGARRNWKNNIEDIWFCTNSENYYFDVESVKLKRKVLAPYRVNGDPKDWQNESDGNFRLTHPSNIWTDLTVPFWSMPENTPHPTQKPEKLFAKLILASSKEGDFVFDPFLGSGTSAVVAEKLRRRWCGIDINMEYLCWARKRISAAQCDSAIQGYKDGVFWERNSFPQQQRVSQSKRTDNVSQGAIFQ